VPSALVGSTIRAAAALTAGQAVAGVVSAEVAALTQATLKSMLLAKLKLTTVVLLTAAALSGSAGVYAYRVAGQEAGAPEVDASTLQPDPRETVRPIADLPQAQPDEAVAKLDNKIDTVEADKKRLQGGWLPAKAIVTGRPTAPKDNKKIQHSTLTFNDDEVAFWDAKGPYTVDPDRKPKELDIVLNIKGQKDLIKAIYDFDGDQLLVSWIYGRPRPPDFDTGKREGVFIVYVRKEKPSREKDRFEK
jgi:uncharacterized protein (TIGR03067 family)